MGIDLSESKGITGFIKYSIDFLKRQESPFKVNIWKNIVKNLAFNLTFQYQSIYMSSLGASAMMLGYINSISGAVNTTLSIPGGVLTDKFGIRKMLLVNLSIYLISGLMFGLSYSWQMAAVALIILTIASTLDRTTCPMVCGATLASEERVTGMGFCDTVSFFPQIVAPLIGAVLITYFGGMNANGIRPVFMIQAVLMIAPILIIWSKFKNPRSHILGRKESIFANIKNVFNEGIVVKRWILMCMFNSFWWQVAFYIPLYAADIKGANQFIVGGISTASTISSVVLAIPFARLADTKGRKKLMTVYGFLACLSYITLIYAPSNMILLVAGFLNGFTMLIGQTQTAVGVDLVPAKYMGSWFGLLGFFRGLVSIVSPIICGYIWEAISPSSVFLLLIATQVAAMITLLTVPTSITR
jgi:MFS family permease